MKQLKNSGYQRQECREIVVSGVKNWLRRRKRREEKGEDFYRSGTSTLQSRIRKKLLDPVRWYKPRPDDGEEDGSGKERKEEGIRKGGKKRKGMDERTGENNDVKLVMFCPYTRNSELAN